jgi:hypothetical protein
VSAELALAVAAGYQPSADKPSGNSACYSIAYKFNYKGGRREDEPGPRQGEDALSSEADG